MITSNAVNYETGYETGVDAAQNYIESHFSAVKGMSSVISAQVCVELLGFQSSAGISGPIVEIGSFEGRMFVALALASAPDEKVYALDTFVFPDESQLDRFRENIKRYGVDPSRVVEKKGNSIDISPLPLKRELGKEARFIHIDGDHRYNGVMHDLMLSHGVMHEDAIICMDDVLHPYYPGLTLAAHDYLKSNPDLAVFAVIDRESIVAASKYLICKRKKLEYYQEFVESKFAHIVRKAKGDFITNRALIISNG